MCQPSEDNSSVPLPADKVYELLRIEVLHSLEDDFKTSVRRRAWVITLCAAAVAVLGGFGLWKQLNRSMADNVNVRVSSAVEKAMVEHSTAINSRIDDLLARVRDAEFQATQAAVAAKVAAETTAEATARANRAADDATSSTLRATEAADEALRRSQKIQERLEDSRGRASLLDDKLRSTETELARQQVQITNATNLATQLANAGVGKPAIFEANFLLVHGGQVRGANFGNDPGNVLIKTTLVIRSDTGFLDIDLSDAAPLREYIDDWGPERITLLPPRDLLTRIEELRSQYRDNLGPVSRIAFRFKVEAADGSQSDWFAQRQQDAANSR